MPLPFILGGLAVAAGLYGVKKMVDSSDNNNRARELYKEAEDIFYRAKNRLDQQKDVTNEMLESLGKTRITVWSEDMGAFVNTFKKFKDIEWQGQVANDSNLKVSEEKLNEIQKTSIKAGEMVKAGFGSLAAGTLAGVAAYGGVGALAAASTGTAISALSGAAATNATLAWLGGGSLAAGGLGIAGGTAVLGGIVAGPVLAVAGLFAASKSEENLAKAESAYSQARNSAEKMNVMTDTLKNIYNIAYDYNNFIYEFSGRFKIVINSVNEIHNKYFEILSKRFLNRLKIFFGMRKSIKVSFNDLDENEQKTLHISWLMAQMLQSLLKQGLLDQNGNIDDKSRSLLNEGKKFLIQG